MPAAIETRACSGVVPTWVSSIFTEAPVSEEPTTSAPCRPSSSLPMSLRVAGGTSCSSFSSPFASTRTEERGEAEPTFIKVSIRLYFASFGGPLRRSLPVMRYSNEVSSFIEAPEQVSQPISWRWRSTPRITRVVSAVVTWKS